MELNVIIGLIVLLITTWWLFIREKDGKISRFEGAKINVPSSKIKCSKEETGDIRTGDGTIRCYNPSNSQFLGFANALDKSQVAEKANKARKAQESWKETSFSERRRVLRSLLVHLEENQREISNVSVTETGKTAIDSAFGEIFMSCEKLEYIIQNGPKFLKRESRDTGLLMFHKKAFVDYVPYGVIGLIIPWNFPIHNVLSHISTALMAGNGVIVKVSEWASWSAGYLEEMCRNWLEACGHNPDLVQFITGFAEAGTAVIENADKVLFIGSPGVGKQVMITAAATYTPVTLELGGKDSFIVCDDADVKYAASMALRGAFLNCGQNCLSAERFYVYDSVYDQFLDEVSKITPKIRQNSSPTCDVGAINLPTQMKRYQELLKDAVSKGAKIVCGGKMTEGLEGNFFEPTIIVNVNHTMRITQEETFGPIMTIIKVSSDEEVIKMANQSEYGLACSIFSGNYKRAESMAQKIHVGTTVVNDWGLSMLIQSMPFGGVKTSGFGKFNGPEGIRDFAVQKGCVTDRFGVKLPPPSVLFFPSPTNVHLLVHLFISIRHAPGIVGKFSAAVQLVSAILKQSYK
eukprot:TRINITY_DN1277_c0_g1_i1.p1 TRINITY_DN1277_c0_g1~~TRINITY_DN1277_c0_g1_i1.p1  ORF type:complete len:626 (+),score=186.35 TRINITY_DN1277_c0_g1_i1:152-1879(+)